jgi:crotonobetainyl-CoA:carnitine CoA-transferase CaiB-like acyl-CoA transferase
MVPAVDHPRAGRVQTIGLPVKFSDTPGEIVQPAPLYGQHSRAILAELGYPPAEIDALVEESVVAEPAEPAERTGAP